MSFCVASLPAIPLIHLVADGAAYRCALAHTYSAAILCGQGSVGFSQREYGSLVILFCARPMTHGAVSAVIGIRQGFVPTIGKIRVTSHRMHAMRTVEGVLNVHRIAMTGTALDNGSGMSL